MLQPKRSRYRKIQKGNLKNETHKTSGRISRNQAKLVAPRYQIVSLSITRLRASTIEAVRRTITRKLKRSGQVLVNVHPSISVTEKPLQVRMGKGKGAVSYWICRIKKGQVLYQIDGVKASSAKSAWLDAAAKLPIKTKWIASW